MRTLSSNPEQVQKRERYAKDAAHRERRREEVRRWKEENRDQWLRSMRNSSLKRTYGITLEQFDQMLLVQGGGCAACGSNNPRGKGRFHVDHCHATGKVRGLLCHDCNLALGNVDDSIDRLEQLVRYLKERG